MVANYMNLYDYIKKFNFQNINIINDTQAWVKNPEHNFIYNKLWIAQSQGLQCGPMNVYPNSYPIVFKPIINLFGMSRGFKIINSEFEYDNNLKDGLFWEEYIEGEQFCVDLIIVNGEVKFCSALNSIPGINGSFFFHESIPDFCLPDHIKMWIKDYLPNYIGPLNLELINGLIIEAHLRLNGDFQLYDKNFVTSLDNLYKNKVWDLNNFVVKKKYLFPIFVKKDITQEKLKFMENQIVNLDKSYKFNSLLIDNIKSNCQSEYLSRAFMIDIDSISDGIKIQKYLENL